MRQLRYVRGARFNSKVAALLPVPTEAERMRAGGRFRDLLPDWAARFITQEPTTTATQLVASGAGRGIATSAAAHLAALCLAGAGTVGACIATGVLPAPSRDSAPPAEVRATPTPAPTSTPFEPEPRLPHGVVTPTPTPTPTPIKRARSRTRTAKQAKTQGGTTPRSHEQKPASPAPSNAAPNGASEFDPTYQPNAPAEPAPVPAAPGASEFN